ncbi:2-iminoacetate synthase [Candidatus Providencia siddallii]|uniref:2-iminoacetate synthase n=1 Tax=Candidatus Providencia siddallii TaxID=1715285 RepID=A0A0M6W7P0_9GAMM|nr:2-iminoacetate synthase [Candidatus Providencia siddallii]
MSRSFCDRFKELDWDNIRLRIYNKTINDVERALARDILSLDDFMSLLSPAALFFIEKMAQKAQYLTRKRFGNIVSFYLPLYLSNLCTNECTYCGFSISNRIKRKVLNYSEIINECEKINEIGFNNILIVTGDCQSKVGINYFLRVIPIIRKYFSSLMMEVQPLNINEYSKLKTIGLDGVLIYQETYNKQAYKLHHIKGDKQNFYWRMETPERIGKAGIDKIGLGALIGLSNCWRTEYYIVAEHLFFLERYFWKSRFSISFPRLRPCVGGVDLNLSIKEAELLQLICAFRLLSSNVELSLSTRESPYFRDNVIPIAINNISAGSKTQPGGYVDSSKELEQFSPYDNRSVLEIANVLIKSGLQPVWKDWEYYLGR